MSSAFIIEADRAREAGGTGGSFAAILRRNMGDTAWWRLHANIRERFSARREQAHTLHFGGVMDLVHCSPAGALIAWILKGMSILPEKRARSVRFDFSILRGSKAFTKCRQYHFAADDTFTFASRFSDEGGLHEEFPGGLGMHLQLLEEGGALIFRDRGYYLRVGKWRLPLPRWLSVGSFELLHRNIDADRFQVIIRISHPLLGMLFYQRGEFGATDSAE